MKIEIELDDDDWYTFKVLKHIIWVRRHSYKTALNMFVQTSIYRALNEGQELEEEPPEPPKPPKPPESRGRRQMQLSKPKT